MEERLQKIISRYGVASRRQAEVLLQEGRVRVNGNTARLGDTADEEEDVIEVDGVRLKKAPPRLVLMLNKPRGYVTTLSDEKGRDNVSQLVDCGTRVYPVGRLDMDSEGLLLLTNDGEFANRLMHPKHEVVKTYHVWVTGFRQEALEVFRKPMELDGYRIRTPEVLVLNDENPDSVKLQISIHEGRNRQVRRMCQAAGLHVTRLRRIAEGPITLGDLKKGSWRHLTEDEVTLLKK